MGGAAVEPAIEQAASCFAALAIFSTAGPSIGVDQDQLLPAAEQRRAPDRAVPAGELAVGHRAGGRALPQDQKLSVQPTDLVFERAEPCLWSAID